MSLGVKSFNTRWRLEIVFICLPFAGSKGRLNGNSSSKTK